jgi:hypothetical protein
VVRWQVTVGTAAGADHGSRALVADSKETSVCAYLLSLTLLLGVWRVRGCRIVVG